MVQAYSDNIDVIETAFPGCTYDGESPDFTCSASGLEADAYDDGYVIASGDDWDCRVSGDGESYCSGF